MYARLQAEESLAGAAVAAAGDAFTERDGRRRIMAAWEDALPREAPKRLTAEQYAARMQMLGMQRVQ